MVRIPISEQEIPVDAQSSGLPWQLQTRQPAAETKDVYCPDILVQVAAVNAALNSFNKVLLANHIRTCVTRDIQDGKDEAVDELVTVLQKLMK